MNGYYADAVAGISLMGCCIDEDSHQQHARNPKEIKNEFAISHLIRYQRQTDAFDDLFLLDTYDRRNDQNAATKTMNKTELPTTQDCSKMPSVPVPERGIAANGGFQLT